MKVLIAGFAIASILTACKREQPVPPAAGSATPEAPLDAPHEAQMRDGATSGDEGGSNADIIDAGSPVDDEVEIADADAAGPRGYAVEGTALWVVTPAKSDTAEAAPGRKRLAKVGTVSWCEADRAASLIWYLNGQGVHAYDTLTAKTHSVIKHPEAGAFEAVRIEYGNAPLLQSTDGLNVDTGVKLTMGTATVEPHVLCEGDREVYCYESQDSDDPKNWKLASDAAAAFELARQARLEDPAFVKAAYRRAVHFKYDVRPKAPTAPKVEVDVSRCDADPDSCGAARWVGGHFWMVTTDNSRGDYFHETEQLFDSRSKEFVNPDDWQRSREPFEDEGSPIVVQSHKGGFAFINGSLIDLRTGRNLWGGSDVAPCGWL